jgi:hypothetical protein
MTHRAGRDGRGCSCCRASSCRFGSRMHRQSVCRNNSFDLSLATDSPFFCPLAAIRPCFSRPLVLRSSVECYGHQPEARGGERFGHTDGVAPRQSVDECYPPRRTTGPHPRAGPRPWTAGPQTGALGIDQRPHSRDNTTVRRTCRQSVLGLWTTRC